MTTFMIKRAYEPPRPRDGLRILVDRLWPRDIRKVDAKLDYWLKDLAPTTALRKWFAHRPERWAEFQRRYQVESAGNSAVKGTRALTKGRRVTLLYSAHDTQHNQARVLATYLQGRRVL